MTAVTIDLQAVAIQDVTVSEDTLSVIPSMDVLSACL